MRRDFKEEAKEVSLKMGYLGEVWTKEGKEGVVADVKTRLESIPGRDNSRETSPEARASLPYLHNISKARSKVSKWGGEQLRSMG